ncbi:hypothetical protein [Synechococcus sp. CC9605]|uniref:hypothetical protein n=1 Tax=Synechococcus sp. (strain CC9605) TaxID=110662 RepID=UPI00059B7C95|nr:hypothetical protein [Synechococcus sp. CC9605]
MGRSLASTVAKLERCQRTPMSITWAENLDLARVLEATGELDLGPRLLPWPEHFITSSGICWWPAGSLRR